MLTILLVDDNPLDRGLVGRELRNEFGELRFIEVTNIEELDQALASQEFDIVITDFHIRWTNGIQVLHAVKSKCPLCPVLMFTGTGSEEVAVDAMKAGLDDYIIKNMQHLVRLRGAVRSALEHTAERRKIQLLESRLQNLLCQLERGAFSCTEDGEMIEVNQALQRMLTSDETDPSEGAMPTFHSLFPSGEDAADALQQLIASQDPVEFETRVASSTGATRTYRIIARRIDCAGESPRIDGLVEDITMRRKEEERALEREIASARLKMLSLRERQVLEQVLAGEMNKTIAKHLEISEKTVEKHRASMMKKLRLRSVAELVRMATLADFSESSKVTQCVAGTRSESIDADDELL